MTSCGHGFESYRWGAKIERKCQLKPIAEQAYKEMDGDECPLILIGKKHIIQKERDTLERERIGTLERRAVMALGRVAVPAP